jgi:regulator of sigma E protease
MLDALQNILIYGGSFIAVLSVVVFVHEFGHFQAARWLKVAIDAFAIGFGKRIAGWRDKQGVEWKIGALPLGGYVKFTGDADAASTGPAEQITDPIALAAARRNGLFHAQPLSTRAIVVAAGPATNFIFSILAFALVLMIVGRDITDVANLPARVDGVQAGSAAATAGLQPGDVVTSIDGQAISSFHVFQEKVAAAPNRTLAISVRRAGAEVPLSVTPGSRETRLPDGSAQVRGFVGVERRTLPQERVIQRVGPAEAIGFGAQQTWMIVAGTATYMADVVTGRQSGEHIAGPVGIMQESGRIAQSALDQPDESLIAKLGELALSLLQWAAILSVAVGIVNLLPIPLLDGGHLLFYAIEAVRGGKPLPLIAQEWAFRAGALVMVSLFLFATWNDVARGFTGS